MPNALVEKLYHLIWFLKETSICPVLKNRRNAAVKRKRICTLNWLRALVQRVVEVAEIGLMLLRVGLSKTVMTQSSCFLLAIYLRRFDQLSKGF